MKKATGNIPLKDVSIAKKLYFIVGTMAILIVIELMTLWFAIHTLSSVRALIGAEGLWSKAQKDAVYHLGKYYRIHDEDDYVAFKNFMKVPLGDHKARLELIKKKPDINIARQGFLEGRVHPDDIDGMIKVIRRFHDNYYIHQAINDWTKGDSIISRLIPIGEAMQQEINADSISPEKLTDYRLQVDDINEQLTSVEDHFSFTLEEGSRWLENLILKILFSVALTVEITGLVITVMVTRNITRGLNEINRAADRITKGHLDDRATVFSNDEIGQTATSVNRMAEQLIASNQDLENFAHIASHDLQEPLRKIMIYTDLLEHELGDNASEKAKQNMKKVIESATGMRQLIEDVLQFAALNTEPVIAVVDLNKKLSRALHNLEVSISKTGATINAGPLPSIEGNAVQLIQLFQNLVGNALKFSDKKPVIDISAEIIGMDRLPGDYWLRIRDKFMQSKNMIDSAEKFCRIYIKDNGIGFDETYAEQIFTAFRRLHGKHVYNGTGIGLAICKKITEKHHGEISAKSTPGKGSTFIIILPFSQQRFMDK